VASKEENGNDLINSYISMTETKNQAPNLTVLMNKEIDEFIEKHDFEMEKALAEVRESYQQDIKEMEGILIY